jgi:hypothetical protein
MAFFLLSLIAFPQNANLSNGNFFDGEPYLAIDPGNPNHIIVSWMGYTFGSTLSIRTIASFNGGETWSSPFSLPHLSPACQSADPSLVFDQSGNILACYVDYRQSPDSGGICIARSVNGGLTWTMLIKVIDAWDDGNKIPIDRPWLTVSRGDGRLFITSKPAPWIAPPNRPYFTSSADGGVTWSHWRYIDGPGFLVGGMIKAPMASPAAASDGGFHCLYPSWVIAQNILPGYIHAKSADGGATFSYNGAVYASTGIRDTLAKAGGHLASDPSDARHLAFIFPGTAYGDLDIFLIESFDDGGTWTGPVRLNSDPAGNGKMQDLAWCDFDAAGNFVAAWRDRRNGADTGYMTGSEIWGCIRWKDSTNFSRNFRISDTLAGYRPVLALNGNDFMTLAVANDTLHAAWGDARSGILSIWYARINLHNLNSAAVREIVHEPVPEVRVFPGTVPGTFRFGGDPVYGVTVNDVSGRIILHRISSRPVEQVTLGNASAGLYIFTLDTMKGRVTVKVVNN